MHAIRRLLARPGLFGWALWLAMLLPVAQAAAIGHGYSHLAAPHADDAAAPHAVACDLCLTAAAVTGGAAPVVHAPVALAPAAQAAPGHAPVEGREAAPALAYRSRAPPLLRS